MAELLVCMPPLTWIATGLLAGWLAARRGNSWRWGFALGFFGSTAGVALAALPRRGVNAQGRQSAVSPAPAKATRECQPGRLFGCHAERSAPAPR